MLLAKRRLPANSPLVILSRVSWHPQVEGDALVGEGGSDTHPRDSAETEAGKKVWMPSLQNTSAATLAVC